MLHCTPHSPPPLPAGVVLAFALFPEAPLAVIRFRKCFVPCRGYPATLYDARRVPSYERRKPRDSRGFDPNRVAMTGKELPAGLACQLAAQKTTAGGLRLLI